MHSSQLPGLSIAGYIITHPVQAKKKKWKYATNYIMLQCNESYDTTVQALLFPFIR
jgi:hypothetical protein